jgi:hypothetical protein
MLAGPTEEKNADRASTALRMFLHDKTCGLSHESHQQILVLVNEAVQHGGGKACVDRLRTALTDQ